MSSRQQVMSLNCYKTYDVRGISLVHKPQAISCRIYDIRDISSIHNQQDII